METTKMEKICNGTWWRFATWKVKDESSQQNLNDGHGEEGPTQIQSYIG